MFERLSAEQLARRGSGRGADPEYVKFVQSLSLGEGGRIDVTKAGVSRQSVKARAQRAAQEVGCEIKFHRSGADEVVFEVVSASGSGVSRRRGRPRKSSQ